MERTVNCGNALDNERIVFRNGALKEYLNLRNNTTNCTYTNAFVDFITQLWTVFYCR